ncbi:SH3 domain-containing protein [Lachnospiraceae bacterium HCP1S3_A8]
MRKHLIILTAAAMTAVMLTACGSGDGIVINGTTAAESGIVAGETSGEQAEGNTPEETSKTGGTKIEIVTGETTASVESLEGQTEPETTQEAGKMIISAETATTGTTAAATKAANPTTAAATKAAAPTTAAATYTVKDVSKTMYASSSVRVRSGYSTSTDVLGALSAGEKVTVTGEVENGWVRVTYKGHTAYVAKNYLTETAPATTNTSSSATSGTSGTNSSSAGNKNQTTTSPTTTINNGTTPGGSTSGNTTAPNGSQAPGNTTAPGGTTNSSSGKTVTGNVTALDPSGLTIQTSDGQSYQFTWGSDVPALAPGEKVQVQYSTDSSGQKQVTGISR